MLILVYIPIDSIESQWRSPELEKHLIETYDLQTNIANEISLDKKLIPETIALKVIELAKNNKEKLASLPSIQPLSNKDLISSILLFEAASISIRSRNFPLSISSEIFESIFGSPCSSISRFNAFAKILAVEVFPTPLGPS